MNEPNFDPINHVINKLRNEKDQLEYFASFMKCMYVKGEIIGSDIIYDSPHGILRINLCNSFIECIAKTNTCEFCHGSNQLGHRANALPTCLTMHFKNSNTDEKQILTVYIGECTKFLIFAVLLSAFVSKYLLILSIQELNIDIIHYIGEIIVGRCKNAAFSFFSF